MLQQRIHTGCSCGECTKGRDKKTRRTFHRSMRYWYKRQLMIDGEILQVDRSIGYTD